MSLTDVVFEVRDPQDPLCKATADDSDSYAILRLTEPGRAPDAFRGLVTFCGSHGRTAGLLRELIASRHHEELEVLLATPETATIRLALRGNAADPRPPLLPMARLLEVFGRDTIFEPVLFRGGRARVRVLLPKAVEDQRVLMGLRELQRACMWPDFRVVRVASMDAARYADGLRRLLTPEQEDILRLAVAMGYYDVPKRATLETIAKRLSLSVSPVHKRLKAIEGILVTAHVDPRQVVRPDFRRRPRKGTALPKPAPLVDVALRVRCTRFAPNSFTAQVEGARVLFQPLLVDRVAKQATALMVALAGPDDYAKLISDLEGHPSVRGVEIIGKDREHVAVHLRMTLEDPLPPDHPYGWWPAMLESDVQLKPVLADGQEMFVRFLLLRPHEQGELLARIDAFAHRGGWEEHEILAVRPFATEGGSAPLPAPERLTPRQDEVLKIAYALGYYRTPRSCTLESVASTLGVSANAIHKNLAAAELNVITGYLSAGY